MKILVSFLLLLLLTRWVAADVNSICRSARDHFSSRSDIAIICQGEKNFTNSFLNWNWATDSSAHLPSVILFARSEDAVSNSIRWISEEEIPFSVRAGRHDYQGFSLPSAGGVIVDTSQMLQITVNEYGIATIGPGARLGEIYSAVMRQGFLFPGGTCPTVGLAGLLLGGGRGAMARTLGLTCDQMIANETHHSDLFWAACGAGGGNLAVFTSFTFALTPYEDASKALLANCTYENISRVDSTHFLSTFLRWASELPEEFTCQIQISVRSVSWMCAVLDDVSEWISHWNTFLQMYSRKPSPKVEISQYNSMLELQLLGVSQCESISACRSLKWPTKDTTKGFKAKSLFVFEHFPLTFLDLAWDYFFLNRHGCCPGDSPFLQLGVMGGAIATAKRSDETAYAYRDAKYLLQVGSWWNDTCPSALCDRTHHWMQMWWNESVPLLPSSFSAEGIPKCYRNYPDLDLGEKYAKAYYGDQLSRLQRIKHKYDPNNFFSFAQEIPPLSWTDSHSHSIALFSLSLLFTLFSVLFLMRIYLREDAISKMEFPFVQLIN